MGKTSRRQLAKLTWSFSRLQATSRHHVHQLNVLSYRAKHTPEYVERTWLKNWLYIKLPRMGQDTNRDELELHVKSSSTEDAGLLHRTDIN